MSRGARREGRGHPPQSPRHAGRPAGLRPTPGSCAAALRRIMIFGAGPIIIGERRRRHCARRCTRQLRPPLHLCARRVLAHRLQLAVFSPAGQACEFDYSGTQACKALK